MGHIQRLDNLLINQIAAGEVIDRPASVVKELLENSIDAGSTQIRIRLVDGGKRLIDIQDNGDGVSKADLPLAIAPHATSKITSFEDLQHVASLGFRGEALASIASVSKFVMISKPTDQTQAYKIKVRGKDSEIEQFPESHPKGTSVRAYDLFFNVPVRQKFLKQAKTEYLYCEEVVRRLALANPAVTFECFDNKESKLFFPGKQAEDKVQRRVSKILGKRFMDNAYPLKACEYDMNVYGYVAGPDYHRSQTDQQFIFLNGRFIKDKLIAHAMRQAYDELIPTGRYPAFVVFLEMDPGEFDVNVHPAKYEVRFHQARMVHDFIIATVRDGLKTDEVISQDAVTTHANQSLAESFKPSMNELSRQSMRREQSAVDTLRSPSKPSRLSEMPSSQVTTMPDSETHHIIIREGSMVIIDLKRFYTQYYFEQLMPMEVFESHPLLFPVRANIDETIYGRLENHLPLLTQLGFQLDRLSQSVLLLRATPKYAFSINEQAFLEALLKALTDKVMLRSRVIQLYLSFIIIDSTMRSESALLGLIASHPQLPKITIDLNKFEVVT